MNVLQIDIKNKIAELSAPALIVCGNSDYVVEFNFDEEWAEHTVKTARFSAWNGYTDVVFEGTQCPVPVLSRASFVKVGVFAGDLRTTTPAYVPCKKSIRCEDGAPVEPKPDVYDRLIQMIEDGMLRGPQGEKGEKGEKGDAGSIKFIPVPASETDDPKDALPEENIDESAIYMVPDPDGSEDNRFIEYAYTNGKWEPLGKITVQVDHSEYAKKTDLSNVDYLAYVNYKGSRYEGFPGLFQYDGGMYGGLFKSTAGGDGANRFRIAKAGYSAIDARSPSNYHDNGIIGENHCKPIVPANLDYAVKAVLTGSKLEWTEEEKAKARALLGIE